MLKLYGGARSRASIVRWYLEELDVPKLLKPLDTLLSDRPYLLGTELTVADIAVGSMLVYVPVMLPMIDLSPYPAVLDYIGRISEREAFKKSRPPA